MTWQCVGIVRLLVCLDITGQNNFPSRLKKKKKRGLQATVWRQAQQFLEQIDGSHRRRAS